MNAKVHHLLNQQINKELYSAYLYLDFANHFDDAGLTGFANWYKIQAREESDHAMLIYHYLHNENQNVTLEAIDKPSCNDVSHMDILVAGLEHEKYVTSLINDIYSSAYEARDLRTMKFLDWFVSEQAEEEINANALITKMELFGFDPKGLYMLDQELAARTYSPPSLNSL
jgi:ferritin